MPQIKNKFLTGAVIILMIAPFLYSNYMTPSVSPPDRGRLNGCSDSIPQPFTVSFREKGINDLTLTESKQYSLKQKDTYFTTSKSDSQFVKFKMKKSPTIAVLLSAVLPGAGQFYNRSYWKIPIITGLIGYFGYEYIQNNNKFKDYRDQYDASITPENPFGDQNLKALREFYRNQRNDFVWYFMIVYVVNLVDAYVDAHLFDFDVKENKFTASGNADRIYRLKMNISF